MIVYLKTIAHGEMWLEAQSVQHDSGGGYTKIKVAKEETRREFFWTSIAIMKINGEVIIVQGKRYDDKTVGRLAKKD